MDNPVVGEGKFGKDVRSGLEAEFDSAFAFVVDIVPDDDRQPGVQADKDASVINTQDCPANIEVRGEGEVGFLVGFRGFLAFIGLGRRGEVVAEEVQADAPEPVLAGRCVGEVHVGGEVEEVFVVFAVLGFGVRFFPDREPVNAGAQLVAAQDESGLEADIVARLGNLRFCFIIVVFADEGVAECGVDAQAEALLGETGGEEAEFS